MFLSCSAEQDQRSETTMGCLDEPLRKGESSTTWAAKPPSIREMAKGAPTRTASFADHGFSGLLEAAGVEGGMADGELCGWAVSAPMNTPILRSTLELMI